MCHSPSHPICQALSIFWPPKISLTTVQLKQQRGIIEFAAEADDALLEKYLGGESLAPEEIAAGLRAVINDSRLTPVFPMIAPKDIGLDEFIENLARFFPSPVDRKHTDAEGTVIDCSENGPFVGLVWRTATDPYAGKLAYMRIFGELWERNRLNCSKGRKNADWILCLTAKSGPD